MQGFDFDVIQRSLPYLFRDGMTFTVTLTAMAMTGGIIFGTLLAMMRLSSIKPMSVLAGGYVNLMRSVPLVLVIFWFFFLVPYIGAWMIGAREPIRVGAFWSSVITFTMFEAAYYCEIMRAGIQSIARGQVWAGYALGLDYWQTMGKIVLPQAFRNMLPVLLTQTIILFQDTSLVYVISATDFLGAAAKIANRDYRLVEMYSFVAIVYFVLSYGLSTLVNGLQAFQKGEILVDGVSVGDPKTDLPKLRSRIGMVFQNFELFPHMTVMRNLTLAQVKVLGRSLEEATQKALKLLERVGLAAHKDKYPGQLSGGQQQRVAIARALAMDPIAMLFDEPTSALDPEMINEVLDVMVGLAGEGMTMMVVTHEMGFARKVAHRVIFMDRGEIVEDALKDDFFGKPRSERAQLFLSKILHH